MADVSRVHVEHFGKSLFSCIIEVFCYFPCMAFKSEMFLYLLSIANAHVYLYTLKLVVYYNIFGLFWYHSVSVRTVALSWQKQSSLDCQYEFSGNSIS